MKLDDFEVAYKLYENELTNNTIIPPLLSQMLWIELYGNVGLAYINQYVSHCPSTVINGSIINSIAKLWCLLESYRLSTYFNIEILKENEEIIKDPSYKKYDLGWGPI